MSSLIKNEIIKIFKKKSIYIMLFIILAFVILTNCIYRFFYDNNTNYMSENYAQYLKEDLAKLDPNKSSDQTTYVEIKTELDTYELANQYEKGSWQQNLIYQELTPYIHEMNTYQYGVEKDAEKLKEFKNKYDKVIEKLNQNDWRYFVQTELDETKEELENLKQEKEGIEDKVVLSQIDKNIESKELEREILNYRLDKNISYADSYQNDAIQRYDSAKQSVLEYKDVKNPSYEDRQQHNRDIKNVAISQYIIENNQDINKDNNLRGILINLFDEYELFIVVFIIMIAGVIVSEEFNKGTIKLLLVRPYKRNKILFAKFITCLIMVLLAIILVVVIELGVGGIVFGFDSLTVPAVAYDFNGNTLITMNVFQYLGIETITKLPLYILLATIAFALSTIFTNSAVAITISLLGYMSTSIINALVTEFHVGFMKFFITMNWDMTPYLFGGLPIAEGMSLGFSIAVCIAYFIILLIPTFIIFKRKNIKNI